MQEVFFGNVKKKDLQKIMRLIKKFQSLHFKILAALKRLVVFRASVLMCSLNSRQLLGESFHPSDLQSTIISPFQRLPW